MGGYTGAGSQGFEASRRLFEHSFTIAGLRLSSEVSSTAGTMEIGVVIVTDLKDSAISCLSSAQAPSTRTPERRRYVSGVTAL